MNTYILNGEVDYSIANVLFCDFAAGIYHQRPEWVRFNHLGMEQADISVFPYQVEMCDALVIRGGDTPTLIHALNSIDGWREVLDNKLIYAFSAGISALMQYSYNQDHGRIIQGLGLIPMQSIVHYTNRDFAKKMALYVSHPKIPILTIRDSETYTIEV